MSPAGARWFLIGGVMQMSLLRSEANRVRATGGFRCVEADASIQIAFTLATGVIDIDHFQLRVEVERR